MSIKKHTSGHPIDRSFTTLKVEGNYKFPDRPEGTFTVIGDSTFNGDISVTGNLTVDGNINIGSVGTTSIQLTTGAVTDYVLVSNDSNGDMTWKAPFFDTNDSPREPTGPTDNNINTNFNVGICITSPEEKLHVGTTTIGEGAQFGNLKVGVWSGGNDFAEIIHSDLKGTDSAYGLKLSVTGDTFLNASNEVIFNILDTEAGRIDSSGNFGIGVTTPTELLHVGGNVVIDGDLTVNGTTTTIDSTVVEIADVNIMLAKDNTADVVDIGVFGQYVDGGVTKYSGFFRDASDSMQYTTFYKGLETKPGLTVDTGATGYELAAIRVADIEFNNNIFMTVTNTTMAHNGLIFSASSNPRVFFNVTGNVGIGVTDPEFDMDVSGGIVNVGELYQNGSLINLGSIASQWGLDTGHIYNINVGNVGIGTTQPVYSLDVSNGDVNTDLGVYRVDGTQVLSSTTLGSGVVNSSLTSVGDLTDLNVVGDLTVDTNTLYVDSANSRVGIGTTGPTNLLHLAHFNDSPALLIENTGGSSNFMEFISTDVGITGGHLIGQTSTGNLAIRTQEAFAIRLQTDGANTRMEVQPDGDISFDTNTLFVDAANSRIGIGTITPSSKLTVVGDARISMDLVVDTDTFVVDSTNDRVGINTASPSVALDIVGDVIISGDLTVNGTTTTFNTETVTIEDPLIILANNNSADMVDTGFYAQYNDGTTKYAGVYRDATDDTFKFFTGSEVEPTTTVNTGATGYTDAAILVGEVKYNDDLEFTQSGTNAFILTNNRFVGVGTTAAYPLHVSRSNTNDWSTKIQNGNAEVFLANAGGQGASINSGENNTETTLILNVRNTDTNNVFTVSNDEKVGINTASPNNKFHVNTGVTGEGAEIGSVYIGNWASVATHAVFAEKGFTNSASGYAIKQSQSGSTIVNAETGQTIRFIIGGTEESLRVSSDGNVGINNSDPQTELDVIGNTIFSNTTGDAIGISNANIDINIANNDGTGIIIDGTVTSVPGFSVRESGNVIFQVNNDGDVGIGTTNPGTTLEVVGTIRASESGGNNIDMIPGASINQINSDVIMTIGAASNQTMTFTTDDKIGIGTTTPTLDLDVIGNQYISGMLGINIDAPTVELHVSGDAIITGDLTIGGNLIFEGIAVEDFRIQDSLIRLASDNTADVVDIGFFGHYIDTGVTKYSGIFRDATDEKFRLFRESEVEPTTVVDIGATGYVNATLVVDTLEADTEVIAPEFTATCDIRVKENIRDMDTSKCLERISNLGLHTYTYKNSFNKSKDTLYGLIAQEVEDVIPEAIKVKKYKGIDDFKTISQNTIMSNLIGAIQQLAEQGKRDRNRIMNLERELLKQKFSNL